MIVKNLLVGLLFCLPFIASAQGTLTGDWKMSVPDEQGNMMTVKLTMTAEGTHTVDFGIDGTFDIEGTHTLEGDQITISDVKGAAACPSDQKGVYKYKVEGDTLTMTRVSDACERGGPEGKMVFARMK